MILEPNLILEPEGQVNTYAMQKLKHVDKVSWSTLKFVENSSRSCLTTNQDIHEMAENSTTNPLFNFML